MSDSGVAVAAREVMSGGSDAPSDRLMIMCDRRDWGAHDVRTAIAQHCDGRIAPKMILDTQLVASELLANAIEHGLLGLITLSVAITGSAVTVSLTSIGDASRIPSPDAWSVPAPTSPRGRGLAIVRALTNTVGIHVAAGGDKNRDWIEITARLQPKTDSASGVGEQWRRFLNARVPFWVALLAAGGGLLLAVML